jgi:hypothetical protein
MYHSEIPERQQPSVSTSGPAQTQLCTLHMVVPEQARRQAKLAAVASGLPFREYVTYLLLQAKPIASALLYLRDKDHLPNSAVHSAAENNCFCSRDSELNGGSKHIEGINHTHGVNLT